MLGLWWQNAQNWVYWKYLQGHKKIPENLNWAFYFLGLFCCIFSFCFVHNDCLLHGLRCISDNNVCSSMSCGHSEPCWRGMWCSAIPLPAAEREFGPCFLLTAADAFLFPFFRDAITGPNVTFLLSLFFLGPLMKGSILDSICGLNNAAAEEFQHKNWPYISLTNISM